MGGRGGGGEGGEDEVGKEKGKGSQKGRIKTEMWGE